MWADNQPIWRVLVYIFLFFFDCQKKNSSNHEKGLKAAREADEGFGAEDGDERQGEVGPAVPAGEREAAEQQLEAMDEGRPGGAGGDG